MKGLPRQILVELPPKTPSQFTKSRGEHRALLCQEMVSIGQSYTLDMAKKLLGGTFSSAYRITVLVLGWFLTYVADPRPQNPAPGQSFCAEAEVPGRNRFIFNQDLYSQGAD